MTFNGFEHFGSFEKCCETAKLQSRATLTELRNELFFAARASRHGGDFAFLKCYEELLPLFKQKLNS
ncbi:MAG: hypothetical protein WA865_21640 [Spirulinaceae cyanobacterium]